MDEIFGVPTSGMMVVLLVMLALCLMVTVYVAIRRPVIFKLGVRNIPRRKAQTILIVIGLMLSTLIISAAMTTGDTLNNSVSSQAYDLLGKVDEVVVSSSETTDANLNNAITNKIPESSLAVVENAVAGDANVNDVAPILLEFVPIYDETTGLGEPEASVTGMLPEDVENFGGLKGTNGESLDFAALQPGEVIITETTQDKLDAKIGDTISFQYQNQEHSVTVAGIAKDQIISGSLDFDSPGMVMHLDQMQQMLGISGEYSAILISNVGDVRGSEEHSDAVEAVVAPALEGQQLGIYKGKQDIVEQSELLANVFTSIFLVMGLFSMAVGILLIVLIFSMLAAERRAEMGMERAVGAQRRQLIQQFIAEGTGYSLIAGLVGAGLGVLVSIGITSAMGSLLGDELSISPSVEPKSLIIAYSLGVVITFLAVVIGSWRISRLNIVAAIRDLPEVVRHRRRPRILIFGLILTALGALMAVGAGESMAMFGIGMSLMPFGLLLITRFFGLPSRIFATLAGLFIVVFWLLPDSTFKKIFGDQYTGDIELFFISGIFLVIGATVVIVQNTDMLLGIVSKFGGLFKSRLPAIRTAVAYPGSARGRTGMTIAMFSLIIFSLVMMATINDNFTKAFLSDDAAAGWTVRADAGIANPIDDFEATMQSQGVDTNEIQAIGEVDSPVGGTTQARIPGEEEWEYYGVHGMNQAYIEDSALLFQAYGNGYESTDAIIAALNSGQPVAVADSSIFNASGGGGFEGPSGLGATDTVENDRFQPFPVEVYNSATGEVTTLTVIGIIDTKLSSMIGLYANRSVTDAIYHDDRGFTSYYLKLNDGVDAKAYADEIESKLLMNGVQAVSIDEELEDAQSASQGFLYLIEGFMGLGLIVGIAAIGVIAFRSVVERRQQIGVLRALGFRRELVSFSFMVETAFVVLMGIISGGGMGLLLARNLFQSDDFSEGTSIAFTIPWPIISVVLIATFLAALLMTWIPARQASRIAPAEALRYE